MRKIFIQKKHILIYILVVIICIFTFIGFIKEKSSSIKVDPLHSLSVETVVQSSKTKDQSTSTSDIFDGTIQLVAGGINVSLPFMIGERLYDVLENAHNRGGLVFEAHEYSGLGFFVTTIGTLREGYGRNLIYFINGQEASVGVSLYIPRDGDVITWELK